MMKANWTDTKLTRLLGIEYPIVQGALGGFATQRLSAEVSNFGGLGSFGGHGLEPAALRDVVDEIRSLTAKPFAMNLWVSMEDEGAFASDQKAFDAALAMIVDDLHELNAPVPSFSPYRPVRFEDQARVLIDAKVPVFSFIFGVPPREILEECRRVGIVTIGGVTTPEEAKVLEQAGVDAIVASGFEAGGHRGSFLAPSEESLTGSFALVPQVVDAVSIPVIAAGGISDARGVAAAFALGADGVQMGTVFLPCEGSGASELHAATILEGRAAKTGLTRGFTGRLARGVRNTMMDRMNEQGTEILPYPLQRSLMKNLAGPALKASREDLIAMWAGQSASLSRWRRATDLLHELVEDVSEKLG